MQLPTHENWSEELLSELQRAVPVLENAPHALFGRLDDETSQSQGSDIARVEDWVVEPSQHSGMDEESAPAGSIAASVGEDAMSLPLTTLTTGKRRTYPNRSTFQAHVCCVMHPSQVPRVLETLRSNPHFGTVRHWPHAYRIISSTDGQIVEGYGDDGDTSAGEKMLGLLKRMRLENLLLITSRWDTGPSDRLGTELFRCINEQCKALLRELQEAVRASFPAEELFVRQGSSRRQQESPEGRETRTEPSPHLGGAADAFDLDETIDGGDDADWLLFDGTEVQDRMTLRQRVFELDNLGPTPSFTPASTFSPSGSPTGASMALPFGRQGSMLWSWNTTPLSRETSSDRIKGAIAAWRGIQVVRCSLAERGPPLRRGGRARTTKFVGEPRCEADSTPSCVGGDQDEGDSPEEMHAWEGLGRQTSEELLRLAGVFRADASALEREIAEIAESARAEERGQFVRQHSKGASPMELRKSGMSSGTRTAKVSASTVRGKGLVTAPSLGRAGNDIIASGRRARGGR